MKKYKSINELLDYIMSKGVIVSNKEDALEKIKRYSYYGVVNSYKDIFKTTSNDYKKNVSFDEIYALYDFDKNIRSIFLKYILEIETIIKSLLAETLSSKYGIENYLILDNFDDTVEQEIIQDSINKIKEEIDKQNGKHEAITHYLSVYGFAPPFVLVKILTLGELSRLYTMLKQVDRQSISKEFKISDKLLKQIMKNMTMIRNICAHNDRLFSFHSKFLITFKIIDKNYDDKDKSTNIYMIMKSMKLLLGNDKGKEFEKFINLQIEDLKSKLKSIDYNIILYLMGFPTNKTN
ncbi:MAG: Abi family protein [Bacilli bacterium]|nr:Abi family protein [Bacilli bacterium]